MRAQRFTDTELFGEAYMYHFTFDRAEEKSNYHPGRFSFSYIPQIFFPHGEAAAATAASFFFFPNRL